MFGTSHLNPDEEQIVMMMKLGRPVRTIAQLTGNAHDYCRRICVRLAQSEGITYTPDNIMNRAEIAPVGITEASRRFRSRLSDKLHLLGTDYRAVASLIGMTRRCQKYARQRPFNHDWTLSQIERLAAALDMDFAQLMREAMHD